MSDWSSFLIGLISGIITTLLAGNTLIRFYTEKTVRELLGRKLLSAELISFTMLSHINKIYGDLNQRIDTNGHLK